MRKNGDNKDRKNLGHTRFAPLLLRISFAKANFFSKSDHDDLHLMILTIDLLVLNLHFTLGIDVTPKWQK
jgi:hypothetical protein